MTITSRKIPTLVGVLVLVLGGCLYGSPGAAQERTVDFSREVRPILSQNCFTCHGPADDRRQRDTHLAPAASSMASARANSRRAESYPGFSRSA